MINLKRSREEWKRDVGAACSLVPFRRFLSDHVFETKLGDLGMVLRAELPDGECLEGQSVDVFTKRFESAIRILDDSVRIYQYFLRSSGVKIPSTPCGIRDIDSATESRLRRLESEGLYRSEIYYVVLFDAETKKRGLLLSLLSPGSWWTRAHAGAATAERDVALATLEHKVETFRQAADFLGLEICGTQDSFRLFERLLNLSNKPNRKFGQRNSLAWRVAQSPIDCGRDHLRIGNYYARILTLKEPPARTHSQILEALASLKADFIVAIEWKKQPNGKMRKLIHRRRVHFKMLNRGLASHLTSKDGPPSEREVVYDEGREKQAFDLGEALKEMEAGNYLGSFTLTVIVYAFDDSEEQEQGKARVTRAVSEVEKIFGVHDASVYSETINALHAFLAILPGNKKLNRRDLLLMNTNFADLSFIFGPAPGSLKNPHSGKEYLAVLTTEQGTPYYFNLHAGDVAHTLVLGPIRSGKSFLLNFLIANLQKERPYTFIFDKSGGGFESLAAMFGGSYLRLGMDEKQAGVNPLALPLTKRNIDFLASFVTVLAESGGGYKVDASGEKEIYSALESLQELDPSLHMLGVLASALPPALARRLEKWTNGGQYGYVFDSGGGDNLALGNFTCFDFQGMESTPAVLEAMLFYLLHRASETIYDPKLVGTFKAFFIDEAWLFLSHPTIQRYIAEALRTWSKHNAGMILSTQSIEEIKNSDIVAILEESTATKIFLPNPNIDRALYGDRFHLNEREMDRILHMAPKGQLLVKTARGSKVVNLNVDRKSYWIYTSDAFDKQKRQKAIKEHGAGWLEELVAADSRK